MNEPPSTPRSKKERAEELYAFHLAQCEAGAESEFTSLLSKNADIEHELREAHVAWSQASGIYRALIGDDLLSDEVLADLVEAGGNAAVSLGSPSATESSGATASGSSRLIQHLEESATSPLRYEVLGEVARGGMGKILKVWDPGLRRQLAMKVATFQTKAGSTHPGEERPLARFLEEAQITGQLDHPCIVPIHEMGLDADGRVYFTMQLVRGRDLAKIFDSVHAGSDDWNTTRAVGAILKVAEAMAYAHDKGVLHRDLKPANIMVGRFGEVYVMDWGLARVQGQPDSSGAVDGTTTFVHTDRRENRGDEASSPLHTHDGDVVGTPAYMPPEQARGEIAAVDQRSDVYSLGAILYHLLAGHVPYLPPGHKRSALDVWKEVQKGPPEALVDTKSQAPSELIAICEKAMARRAEDRYPSMELLARDLLAYLDGRVVQAFETGAVAEFKKWVRRNRPTAIASAAAILLAVGGLAWVSWIQTEANRELGKKNAELALARDAAEASATEARRERDRADAQAALARDRGQVAEERAREAARERDSADQVADFLVDLFHSPDPAHARGETLSVQEILDRGAQRISEEEGSGTLVDARMREAMGQAYLSLGLFDKAEPLLVAAYEGRLAGLGASDRRTLESMNAMGEVFVWRGRHEDALGVFEDALEIELTTFGEDDALTRRTLSGLATLFFRSGERELSEEYRLRALSGYEENLGPDAPETLESYGQLALLYRAQERFDEAEEYFTLVFETRRERLGPDHPDTLRASHQLASLFYFRQDHEQAERRLRATLSEMQRVLGAAHPDTLGCVNDLSLALLELQEFEAAADLLREALPGFKKAYGPNHILTLGVQNNLAVQLTQTEKYVEAEELLLDSLERFALHHDPGHPSSLAASNSLGFLYSTLGQTADALRHYERALEGALEQHGPGHRYVHLAEESVATCLFELGDPEGALEHIARAMAGDPGPTLRARLEELAEAASQALRD